MAITPRPHQIDALKNIKKGFNKHNRGQVIMACGTGKSLLAAWAVKTSKARTVLALVPSLALVRQVRESFLQVFPRLASVAVCSDKTVAGRDAVSIDPSEVGCLVTTDVSLVRAHLKQSGQRVVFCTYQSASLLAGFKFDFAIFDEAHKTAGCIDKAFGFALDDKNIAIKKRLFLTATPRVVRLPVDTEETEDVASMDDPQVYGSRFYSLPFREAVDKKIICGYRLVISEINEDVDTEHQAALQVAIQKSMDARGIKKVFAFFRTVEQAQTFANDTAGFDPSVTVLHVNGSMSTGERKLVISQFEKAERAVLTNARCLTEGVDVPAVDMVVFAQAKRSTIDIVQAAGRAMRNSPGKKLGFIFLPVWRNAVVEETFETAAGREGFKPVLDVLRALSDQDALLEAVLEDIRSGESGGRGGIGPIDIVPANPLDLDALRRAVEHAVIDQKRPVGYWTLPRCLRAAANTETLREFRLKESGAYSAAQYMGWLPEVTASLVRGKMLNEVAKIKIEKSIKEHGFEWFRKNEPTLYRRARYNKWIPYVRSTVMTKAQCSRLLLNKFSSRKEAQNKQPTAYYYAKKNGWEDLLPSPIRASFAKYTREDVIRACSKVKSITQLRREYPWAYSIGEPKGWLDSLLPRRKTRRPWDKNSVKSLGATCRSELKRTSRGAYRAALKNKWMDELFPVLKKKAA